MMEEKDNSKVSGTRNIKETVPEEDRPRERFMVKGAQALRTAELLAILIGSGTTKEPPWN